MRGCAEWDMGHALGNRLTQAECEGRSKDPRIQKIRGAARACGSWLVGSIGKRFHNRPGRAGLLHLFRRQIPTEKLEARGEKHATHRN